MRRIECIRPGGSTAVAVGLLGCVLVVAGLLASAPAVAQSGGNLCIKEKVGGNPPCTAGDVRVGRMVLIAGDTTCEVGQPYTGTFEATIESGPDRWAIGLWVNEDGGSALSDPDGTCYRDYLHPVDDSVGNDGCQQLGGPYFDGDEDACGDVYAQNTDPCGTTNVAPCTGSGGMCLFTTYQFTATITCNDSNMDGTADVGTCTSWDNQTSGVCNDELGTDPGTGSKCNCGDVAIVGLFSGCTADDQCDDGVACTDDECTMTATMGECSNTPVDSACDDGNVCTLDTCDAVDDCSYANNGALPQCNEGNCIPTSCDDIGNDCTEGACNPDGTCALPVAVDDSTPCEDGNVCTSFTGVALTADHCEAGVCTGGPVDCSALDDQCNDGVCNATSGACEAEPENDSTPCEDGNVCTSFTGVALTADHCEAGVCTGGPVDCSALDDQCNDGVCNATSGACEAEPENDSTPCEDGNVCTSFTGVALTADHCEAGVCTGGPVDCSALDDQCNDGVCNATSGACEAEPENDSTPCEDGNVCTSFTGVALTADHCEAGVCTGGPVDCSALDDQCNDGVCNATSGACEAEPENDSTPCEDGNVCTSFTGVALTADHCEAGVCTGGPVDCSALDDQCNDGVCNATSGACEAEPENDSTPCEDGNVCTSFTGVALTADHCEAGVCTGGPVDCSALDDQCNDGVCNATSGACEAKPENDSTPCEDGFFCTSFTGVAQTPDHCESGVCTGRPVECPEPTSSCNSGATCDVNTGTCDNGTPDPALCKDPCSGDGKQLPPSELEFLYVNTAGDALFDEVCIIVTHHRGDVWELENVTDYFSFRREKRLQPKIEIEICSDENCSDTSTCAEPIQIHTSCSLPLNIGDLFGPNNELKLTGEIFASEPPPAPVRTSREAR